jgi:hypothetical protein
MTAARLAGEYLARLQIDAAKTFTHCEPTVSPSRATARALTPAATTYHLRFFAPVDIQ